MTATVTLPWTEETWRENILRRELRSRAESLTRLAIKLEDGEDFPTDTPPKLCQLVNHTARMLGKEISNVPVTHLKYISLLLCNIAEHLRFVERSRIEHTPWSMIQATEHFFKKHTGKECHFIIRPQWSYNYGLIGEFVEVHRTKLQSFGWFDISGWEKAIGSIAHEKLFCISFPRIDRLNCLLHANWGHEIGHIIAAEWIQNNFSIMWQQEETKIKGEIEIKVKQDLPPVPVLFKDTFIKQMVAENISKAMKAAEQGLKELISDILGIHFFGPAALASASSFSAPHSPDENPLSRGMYPPWRYRLRLMVQACEEDLKVHDKTDGGKETKYPGAIIQPYFNWLSEIKNLVAISTDKDIINKKIATKVAYKFIEDNWEVIKTEVLELLPSGSKQPYRLFEHVSEIEQLVDKLEHNIPPNEFGEFPDYKHASFEDILNAAWIFKELKLTTDATWRSADDFENMYRLVLKAIESSFVHNEYGEKLKELEKE